MRNSRKKMISVLPFPYESMEDVNSTDSFRLTFGGTVYAVNTHFDENGRKSVFGQLRENILSVR